MQIRTPPRAAHRARTGFTALELLVVMAITAVLCSIAYPSFRAQIEKSRRADAIESLVQVQMAEERWRASRSSYGGLSEIGATSLSTAGHYSLAIGSISSSGYEILATARGAQSLDAPCRHLRLGVDGANFAYASGPDASVANSADLNRRCWSL
ncbi:MAG: type IV pilin protein [Caldimonas sp.]